MKKDAKKYLFSDETIKSLSKLGEVLRRIHNRMTKEGYMLRDEKIKMNMKNEKD